jgi:hypothetical protein
MLFIYSDHNYTRLDFRGETCLKHLSQRHPGVGTGFLFPMKGGDFHEDH